MLAPALSGFLPKRCPDESDQWVRTLYQSHDEAPLYLRELDKNFLREDFGNGTYIRAAVLFNRANFSITEELARILATKPVTGYDFLAVDLRWSPGGDFGTVADFAEAADGAMNEDGKIYIITGPQTFSAAIVSAALFKRYNPR